MKEGEEVGGEPKEGQGRQERASALLCEEDLGAGGGGAGGCLEGRGWQPVET